jgi:NAD(P)-dependent dehydrogenase (short-subunit alcohol dehydrogenase family)
LRSKKRSEPPPAPHHCPDISEQSGGEKMTALDGKVAIVTGASSGIGRAAAALFAREGARVVVAARRREQLDDLVAHIEAAGGVAAAVTGDVREEEHARALVRTAVERFGGLDVAFNNAGIETNLTGAFLAARHQVPAMVRRGGGSIIFTSSFVGHTAGVPGTAAYAASKAGLIALTMTMAAELGAHGIRVNALLPGGTDTPAYRIMASTPEAQSAIAAHHALRRVATPDEIARSALYLASDASSFTTGSALLADGGVSMYWT